MDSMLMAPNLSDDGSVLTFTIVFRGRVVQCGITRDALVQYFRVPADAVEQRFLRAYENGRQRIHAIAERKIRASMHEPVIVSVSDFAHR
ncbi:DUF1488 family protein [Caballeronia sp. LZ001]|uniref:DUF1488 family protein n=1 Tax=Caballeronia sp. LZ001 TaxID=3038553 RepID=UPI0028665C7A|nr:DUF1488 family protein [Caballeronia sp. LZ001]MDR5804941.1 DUF1488 family protein [Caballeronia sp. LZ001]